MKIRGDKPLAKQAIKDASAARIMFARLGESDKRRKQANVVRKLTHKAKKSHYNRFINGNPNWWKAVNEIRLEKKQNEFDQTTIDMLNNNFHSQTLAISKNHSIIPPIKEQDVVDELGKLKNNKAGGPDGINAKTLKAAKFELADIITHIFSLCLKHSIVPAQWKDANIVLVPKIKSPATANDYRPISLTSTLCKVLERIITKRMLNLTKDVWMTNQQFGFLPERNTTDALVQVIEDWSKAYDNHNAVHAIFFDFSKAFDLVNHQLLLSKTGKVFAIIPNIVDC